MARRRRASQNPPRRTRTRPTLARKCRRDGALAPAPLRPLAPAPKKVASTSKPGTSPTWVEPPEVEGLEPVERSTMFEPDRVYLCWWAPNGHWYAVRVCDAVHPSLRRMLGTNPISEKAWFDDGFCPVLWYAVSGKNAPYCSYGWVPWFACRQWNEEFARENNLPRLGAAIADDATHRKACEKAKRAREMAKRAREMAKSAREIAGSACEMADSVRLSNMFVPTNLEAVAADRRMTRGTATRSYEEAPVMTMMTT